MLVPSRLIVRLIVLLGLIGGVVAPAAARNYALPQSGSTSNIPAAPAADSEYAWVAGSTFIARDSTTAFETTRAGINPGGCIYAKSSGEFTSQVPVPNGATITAIDLYWFDSNTSNVTPTFTLQDTNGKNFPQTIATIAVSTSVGMTSQHLDLASPYTVNQQNRGVFMEWSPKVFSEQVKLCGVRLTYTAPALPLPPTDYAFLVGSNFTVRDSTTERGYSGAGCVNLKVAGRYLTMDVDLPEGAVLQAMSSFFVDNAPTTDFRVSLIESTGSTTQTLATITQPMTSTLYNEVSFDFITPYTVHEKTASLSLLADFGGVLGSSIKFCGVRFAYANPAQSATTDARFITGNTFVPRSSGLTFSSDTTGCVSVVNDGNTEDLNAYVRVPNGATITRVTYYFKADGAGGANLFFGSFDAAGTWTQVVSVPSGAGTSATVTVPNGTIADNSTKGYALVWDPGIAGPSRTLCGAKVEFSFTQYIYLPLILK